MSSKISVVKVLLQNDQEEFLVLQKSDEYDWKAGKWELPGGKIEETDTDKNSAAIRELMAETGLKVESFTDVVRVEIEEPENGKPVIDCWILLAKDFTGEVELSDEHQEYKWTNSGEFSELDWHRDAGYCIPVMKHLDSYLQSQENQ